MSFEEPKRLQPKIKTLRELFAKSGNICAYPGCDITLIDTEGEFGGEVCHIEGVRGERFNPKMSNEQRRKVNNLLILCLLHHKKTDNENEYTVEKLKKIKKDHEEEIRNKLEKYVVPDDVIDKIYEDFKMSVQDFKETQTHNHTEVMSGINNIRDLLLINKSSLLKGESVETEVLIRVDTLMEIRDNDHSSVIQKLEKLANSKDWLSYSNYEKYKILANIGICFLETGENEKAAEKLIEAFDYNNKDEKALALVSLAYSITGNLDQCKFYIEQCRSLNANNILANIAIINSKNAEIETSEIHSQLPEELANNADILINLSFADRKKGNIKGALNWAEKAFKNDSSNNSYLKAYYALGILENSIDIFEVLINANVKTKRRDIKYALKLLTEAWNEIVDPLLKGNTNWILVNRCIAKRFLGDHEGAYNDIIEALNFDQNKQILSHLIVSLINLKRLPEALDVINQDIFDKQEDYLLKAEILYNNKQFEDCITFLEFNQNKFGNVFSENSQGLLIQCLLKTEQHDKALDLVQKEETVNSFINTSKIYRSLSDHLNVLLYLNKAFELINESTDHILIFDLAQEFYFSGEIDISILLYERITDVKTYSELSINLLQLYLKIGDYGKALNICNSLTDEYGFTERITNYQSHIYFSIDNRSKAKEILLLHLKTYPDDQLVVFNLCLLLIHQGELYDLKKHLKTLILDKFNIEDRNIISYLFIMSGLVKEGIEISYNTRNDNLNSHVAHGFFASNYYEYNHIFEEDYDIINEGCYVKLTSDTGKIKEYIIESTPHNNAISIQSNELIARKLINKKNGEFVNIGEKENDRWKISEICSKYSWAFNKSLNLLGNQFSEISGFKQFTVGETGDFTEDFKYLIETLENQNRLLQHVYSLYQSKKITFGLLMNKTRQSTIYQWLQNVSTDHIGFYSDSLPIQITNIVKDINSSVVIDLTSILCIFQIGAENLLLSNFTNIYIAQSCLDELNSEINKISRDTKRGIFTFGKRKASLISDNISPNDADELYNFLCKIVGWIKQKCVVAPTNEALNINFNKIKEYELILGKTSFRSFLIGKEYNIQIFSDEELARKLIYEKFKVEAYSTYDFLSYSFKKQTIDQKEFSQFTSRLIRCNYRYIPIDCEILFNCYIESKSEDLIILKKAALCLMGDICTLETAVIVFFQFMNKIIEQKTTFEEYTAIAHHLFRTLIINRSPITVYHSLIAASDLTFLVLPEFRLTNRLVIFNFFKKIIPYS